LTRQPEVINGPAIASCLPTIQTESNDPHPRFRHLDNKVGSSVRDSMETATLDAAL
jgi:hypothetical protein